LVGPPRAWTRSGSTSTESSRPSPTIPSTSAAGSSPAIGPWRSGRSAAPTATISQAATGQRFSFRDASVFKLADGKIHHYAEYWDAYIFLVQLDPMPAPEAVGTPMPLRKTRRGSQLVSVAAWLGELRDSFDRGLEPPVIMAVAADPR
jgi:hypothetical protein